MDKRHRSCRKRISGLMLASAVISVMAIVCNVSDNVVADEWIDVDYDEIVAEGDEYYLLKKNISGFTENRMEYAIYNWEEQCFALDYIDLPEDNRVSVSIGAPSGTKIINDNLEFIYNGDGVFSYSYYNGDSVDQCFLSENANGYFLADIGGYGEEIQFIGGKSLVLINDHKSGYVDGHMPPNAKLCWITDGGDITDFKMEGYNNQTPEQFAYLDSGQYGKINCFAYTFINIDREKIMLVYDANREESVYITDADCLTRLSQDSYVQVECSDDEDEIQLNNLLGDDGKLYYATFDMNGKLIEIKENA